jgi:catechol 2,3-dioxygenase-like lactoylglutathione lyase family enzyme
MLRERPDSEVEAVDDVRVEAALTLAEASRQFYVEILGLQEDERPEGQAGPEGRELCFWGQHNRLILQLVEAPRVQPLRRKALICVKSLQGVRDLLDDRRIEYVRCRSLGWAGERLQVWDPSGNLVELRQERLL